MRYQTLTYQIPDNAGLTGVTSVTVQGNISGCISENTRIRNVYGTDALSSQINALVGVPVDIESTGEFNSVTIVFSYSDEVDEENLKILWYDEDNNQYVVLNNSIKDTNANTVSATVTHFSRYMLIDEKVWVRTWSGSCTVSENYYRLLDWGYDMDKYIAWLNRQTDSDGDGLPDIIETNGMINNIGLLIKTDPNNADTDGDGLSDGEEMGLIPRFVIDAVPNIESEQFNSFRPATYSRRWSGYVYYSQTSDPTNGDTDGDGDGFFDYEDALPEQYNNNIIYIFYTKKFTAANNYLYNKYTQAGYLVCSQLINNANDLMHYWEGIGLYDSYFSEGTKPYGDKYYYNPLSVILIADGTLGAFTTENGDFYSTELYPLVSDNGYEIASLNNKRINYLWLAICHSAESQTGYSHSVATEFIRNNQINTVYAYDGILVSGEINHNFIFYTLRDPSVSRKGLVMFTDDTTFTDVYWFDVKDAPDSLSVGGFFFLMFNSSSYDPIEDFVIW